MSRRGLLVGVAGLGAAIAFRSRPKSVAPRDVPSDRAFPVPELMVSPPELAPMLSARAGAPHLLDASPLADFRDKHIPGARHVWWQDTMELNAPYYGMVLKPDDGQRDQTRRRRLLERWQVHTGVPVVVYDRDDGARAARVVWFLRFLSIPAQMLDGGYAGWLALDEAARDAPAPELAGPTAEPSPREGFYLGVPETAALLDQSGAQLVDVRTAEERANGELAGKSAPGVAWLPRNLLIDANGLVRPAPELATLLSQAGVDLSRTLVTIGDTGLDSSLPWLALMLMGARSAMICDGGWQEWRDLPELPTVVTV